MKSKPFYGLPISVKECVEMNKSLTNFGSLQFKNYVCNKDSTYIKLYKEYGCIIVCKSSSVSLLMMPSGASLLTGNILNP